MRLTLVNKEIWTYLNCVSNKRNKMNKMKNTPYDIKEFGHAEISIKLHEGLITITHYDGTPLFEKVAEKGDWEKIWRAIDPQREEWLQGKYERNLNI